MTPPSPSRPDSPPRWDSENFPTTPSFHWLADSDSDDSKDNDNETQYDPILSDEKEFALKKARDDLICKQRESSLTPEEKQKLEQLETEVCEHLNATKFRKQAPNKSPFAHSGHNKRYGSEGLGGGAKKRPRQSRTKRSAPKPSRRARTGARLRSDERFSNILGAMGSTDRRKLTEEEYKTYFKNYKSQLPQAYDTRRTATQAEDIQDCERSFGDNPLYKTPNGWKVNGLLTTLSGYQVTPVKWMIEKERASGKPDGGILADEPGFGKTIMSLACMLSNKCKDMTACRQTTLIICPSRDVAHQWYKMITEHCEPDIAIKVHVLLEHDESLMEAYKDAFALITTQYFVTGQYPSKALLSQLKVKHDGDPRGFRKAVCRELDYIFDVDWFRVIVDEAHIMKNWNSKTSKALCSLRSKYYWALSGTPLANSPEELYSYLQFIGSDFIGKPLEFNAKYAGTSQIAKKNYDALVSLVMFRRTQKDTFLGELVLPLPPNHRRIVWVSLSETEKAFYRVVNQVEGGDGGGGGGDIRGMALFRFYQQVASHPFNAEKMFRRCIPEEWVSSYLKKSALEQLSTTFLEQIQQIRAELNGLDDFRLGLEILQEAASDIYSQVPSLREFVQIVKYEHDTDTVACPSCNKTPMENCPMGTKNCEHIYCMICLQTVLEPTIGEKQISCIASGCDQVLQAGSFIVTFQLLEANARTNLDKKRPGSHADANTRELIRKPEQRGWMLAVNHQKGPKLFPGAKVTAAVAVAIEWLAEASEDKIIIFTQFIGTGQVIASLLKQCNIEFLYYYGSIGINSKAKALDGFKSAEGPRILISSLKCGGQSLNLTVANRVIIVDPWFNVTAERQALARVLRRGQVKESHCVHIFAQDTIDERFETMRNTKAGRVDYALQDDEHDITELDDYILENMFMSGSVIDKRRRV